MATLTPRATSSYSGGSLIAQSLEYLRRTVLTNPWIPITPTPKQALFLSLPTLEAFYGGSGGGGKSIALLAAAAQFVPQPGYNALLLRRTYGDLSMPEALMDVAGQWWGGTAAKWNDKTKTWLFPAGASITFGYMEHENDKWRYRGGQYQFIGWDELTAFSESQYRFLFGWLRQPEKGVFPLRVRSASNPGGIGHEWVRARFIDSGDPQRPFIPARLTDNPYIQQEQYRRSLAVLDPVTRAQIESGDWTVRHGGSLFRREWFEVVDEAPARGVKWVRYYDLASTEPKKGVDPDWTAGALVGFIDGVYYIRDMRHVQTTPAGVESLIKQTAELDGHTVAIRMEQEPGAPLSIETPILMGDGTYKRLGDINVGDMVIAMSGQPCLVEQVHEQGVLPTVVIQTRSGRGIVSALSHPFLTPNGWKAAGELTEGDVLGLVPRPSIEGVRERRAEEFRLAGYFVGDGACGPSDKHGRSICAEVINSDPEIRADIERCAESLGFRVNASARTISLRLSGGVRPWLRDVGLAGKRAHDKVVPAWVYRATPNLIAEFIGAYFACDGHVRSDHTGRGLEFYSASPELLRGVQRLLLRLGISSKVNGKKKSSTPRLFRGHEVISRLDQYRLSLLTSNDGHGRFAELIPVVGPKGRVLSGIRRVVFDETLLSDPIRSIVPTEPAECRCLTIQGEHTFTASDFVVHNSGVNTIDQYARRVLVGYDFRGVRSTGSKVERARPVSSAAEASNIKLVNGPWVGAFLDEAEAFPEVRHDDQIDAVSGALAYFRPSSGRKGGTVQSLYAPLPRVHNPLGLDLSDPKYKDRDIL